MPLFLRAMRDHYPDDDTRSARTMAGFVALSGSYACGLIARSATTAPERRSPVGSSSWSAASAPLRGAWRELREKLK
jgi:hypothetical protein